MTANGAAAWLLTRGTMGDPPPYAEMVHLTKPVPDVHLVIAKGTEHTFTYSKWQSYMQAFVESC